MPTDPAELREGFEEQSGLTVPSDATDLEIEGTYRDGDLSFYELRFTTTRGGAEDICAADGFQALPLDGPPDAGWVEDFPVQEDNTEIASTVRCRGGHPTEPVQRGVLVVFTEAGMVHDDGSPDGGDAAVVYAYSGEYPG
jgi:hypothetical protein